MTLQRCGGWAAAFEALAYLIGFGVMLTVLAPGLSGELSEADRLAFMLENRRLLAIWNLIIYVLFGIALVILTLALHERLRSGSPSTAAVATVFGVIWAGLVIASGMIANIGLGVVADMHGTDPDRALTVWRTLDAVQNGIGGGVEVVGGVWVGLISVVAVRARAFNRLVNGLGVLAGIAGVLTMVPGLGDLGALFGLLQIPWFIGVGAMLLRAERVYPRRAVEPSV